MLTLIYSALKYFDFHEVLSLTHERLFYPINGKNPRRNPYRATAGAFISP